MAYNGWKNYETWNVALWIGNDEGLYHLARDMKHTPNPYEAFAATLRDISEQGIKYETPDGVAWNDSGLDTEALNEMIRDL